MLSDSQKVRRVLEANIDQPADEVVKQLRGKVTMQLVYSVRSRMKIERAELAKLEQAKKPFPVKSIPEAKKSIPEASPETIKRNENGTLSLTQDQSVPEVLLDGAQRLHALESANSQPQTTESMVLEGMVAIKELAGVMGGLDRLINLAQKMKVLGIQ